QGGYPGLRGYAGGTGSARGAAGDRQTGLPGRAAPAALPAAQPVSLSAPALGLALRPHPCTQPVLWWRLHPYYPGRVGLLPLPALAFHGEPARQRPHPYGTHPVLGPLPLDAGRAAAQGAVLGLPA